MDTKTFRFIYSEWVRHKALAVKQSTLSTYISNAERHLLPAFGGKKCIDEGCVQRFINAKATAGLSRNTLRDLLMLLRMITVYGHRRGWTDYRGWYIKLPVEAKQHHLPVLALPQERRMIAALRRKLSLRNIGLYLCLCTGMRIGEICALRWGDISIERRSISVRRTVSRIMVRDGGSCASRIIINTPKTANSSREVPLNTELMRLLRPFCKVADAADYVLTNSDKPLEPRLYRGYFQRFMRREGLPDITFHGLRHTFATRCVESGCDYKTVSAILGHANISTTMNLYVHPDMEQKRRCVDKMLRKLR